MVTAISNLPDSNVRDALQAQVTAANNDLNTLRTNIGVWFDQEMDRVSGIYKRYLKWLSLTVGLAVAAAFNADSIQVSTALWQDSTLRAEMVQSATVVLETKRPATSTAPQKPTNLLDVMTEIKKQEAELRPLPIGWDFSASMSGDDCAATLLLWVSKILGLLWTAAALSLGAPFWFDLLSKFMQLRGTGLNRLEPSQLDPESRETKETALKQEALS